MSTSPYNFHTYFHRKPGDWRPGGRKDLVLLMVAEHQHLKSKGVVLVSTPDWPLGLYFKIH